MVDILADINDSPHTFVYSLKAKNAKEAEAAGLKKLKDDLESLARLL